MIRRAAVIAVVGTACIKLASFHPLGDGGPDATPADAALPGECGNGGSDTASASISGGAICAAGPGFVLRFPQRGFGFPDQLRIGSNDVLGSSTGCNQEDKIGLVAYPLPRFSADIAGSASFGSATIELAGPVVAKVRVTWSWDATTTCATAKTFSGISTFTLFPDGRLVRYDEITTPVTANYAMCDCGSGAAEFFTTSYLTLAPTPPPTLTDMDGTQFFPNTGQGAQAPQLMCAAGSDWGIGISQPPQGYARTITGGALALTYAYPDAYAVNTLPAEPQSTIIGYSIGSAACTPRLADIAQFTMSSGPQLQLHSTNGFNTMAGTQRDGIYGGDNGTGVGMDVGSGTLTLTTPTTIPAGWALWVTGAPSSPTASPARTGDWFKIQKRSTDAILWFRDALGSGETITVQMP